MSLSQMPKLEHLCVQEYAVLAFKSIDLIDLRNGSLLKRKKIDIDKKLMFFFFFLDFQTITKLGFNSNQQFSLNLFFSCCRVITPFRLQNACSHSLPANFTSFIKLMLQIILLCVYVRHCLHRFQRNFVK